MKVTALSFLAAMAFAVSSVQGFVPSSHKVAFAPRTRLQAKYNTMDEILALFPEEKPVLINFYDASTEAEIKDDIFRAKKLLEDRATVVSIKQQDYPDLAKLWDCAEKSPSMILFKDGTPVTRLYEETFYVAIIQWLLSIALPEQVSVIFNKKFIITVIMLLSFCLMERSKSEIF